MGDVNYWATYTVCIVRQFQRRRAFFYIDVEDVVILLALVKLFPPGSDGIDYIADFLPAERGRIPLTNRYWGVRIQSGYTYLMSFYYCPVAHHLHFTGLLTCNPLE